MARVQGPLMSMSASGAVGKAIVFSVWNGLAYVRRWLKPLNPQEIKQGNRRIMIGGTGRACGKVEVNSEFHKQLLTLGKIPSNQSKQSYLVKYILDHYLTNPTAYTAELAACTGHTAYTAFQAAADTLGITEFDLDYAAIAPYDKALGLYLLAKTAIDLGFTGAPYTTNLSSWTGAQIDLFVDDFKAA